MKSIVILAISFLFLSQGEIFKKIDFSDDIEKFRSSVMDAVPAGTDIYIAENIMEYNGFSCSLLNDSSFAEKGRIYEHIDFLYCSKEKGFFVSRRWQVAIVHQDNIVKYVLASTGLTGP